MKVVAGHCVYEYVQNVQVLFVKRLNPLFDGLISLQEISDPEDCLSGAFVSEVHEHLFLSVVDILLCRSPHVTGYCLLESEWLENLLVTEPCDQRVGYNFLLRRLHSRGYLCQKVTYILL